MMSYSETSEEVFTYFDKSEEKIIETWLKEHGYTWGRPTLCGNCCGFYVDEYYVNGIGGEWKSKAEFDEFIAYLKQHNVEVKAEYPDYSVYAVEQE